MSFLTVRLEPDQLRELAVMIAEEQAKRDEQPLSVSQAAKLTGWSGETIRRRINAGLIKTLPGHKKLIPASEINRLKHAS